MSREEPREDFTGVGQVRLRRSRKMRISVLLLEVDHRSKKEEGSRGADREKHAVSVDKDDKVFCFFSKGKWRSTAEWSERTF